jgi:hypothetical protein
MAQKNKKTKQNAPQNMPLFYTNPVMLDRQTHAQTGVRPLQNYDFARHVNAVPITLIELPLVVSCYPIVFTSGDAAMPVALLGLHEGKNLFVNEDGTWQENCYIPAYIRRYPFIFADQGHDKLTLCVEDAKGILSQTEGERLFSEQGEMTEFTASVLGFCKSYHAASQDTASFAAQLQKADILIERQATVRIEGRESYQLAGFRQIDEEKFRKLDPALVAQWHEKNWLGALYASLLSMSNWQTLFNLAQSK